MLVCMRRRASDSKAAQRVPLPPHPRLGFVSTPRLRLRHRAKCRAPALALESSGVVTRVVPLRRNSPWIGRPRCLTRRLVGWLAGRTRVLVPCLKKKDLWTGRLRPESDLGSTVGR